MSTYSERDFTPILAAAAAWAQQCLVQDGTILGGGAVWTAQSFADLDQYFVNQPDAGQRQPWNTSAPGAGAHRMGLGVATGHRRASVVSRS